MRARTSPHGTQFGPYTVLDLHELPEDGKGFELEDGWLIEVAASSRHNWALRTFARIIERAAAEAGSQAIVCDGGEWEISTPAGVRKPDVFVVPREIAPGGDHGGVPQADPGHRALPGGGGHLPGQRQRAHRPAAQGRRVRQAGHSAVLDRRARTPALGPGPDPGRRNLHGCADGNGRCTRLEAVIDADKPFTVSFDPADLLDF